MNKIKILNQAGKDAILILTLTFILMARKSQRLSFW